MNITQRRQTLLALYQSALDAVSGERAVSHYLEQHPFDNNFSLIAIGKAAAAMARGAVCENLRSALVITKYDHRDPSLNSEVIQQLESAHPVPDEQSLEAGRVLLEFLDELPDGEPLLFLLSGGASALVEVLPDGVGVDGLVEMNQRLLASGMSIGEMNAQRKVLSQIKGGKLIPYLKGRPCLQLLISDVPGDDLGVIGSGPLIGEATNIESHIVANNAQAREALRVAAKQSGESVLNHVGHFEGDAEELAAKFCEVLLRGEPGIYLWGGESSVVMPSHSGRGGRNQQLALSAARYLAGHDNVLLMAVATDGSDGPTDDVGALVDGGTVQRGESEGLSAMDALQQADAGSFLEASGDLLQTGPTGTNVMDLVIAWKW